MENVVTLHSKSTLVGSLKTEIKVREFHPFHIDEPVDFGGTDEAPNPMEYILSGLNGCETVMAKMIAKELDIQIDHITIESSGDLDIRGLQGNKEVSPYFQGIKQHYVIETSADAEKIEELFKVMKERCPAYNLMVAANIPVDITYSVNTPTAV